jgi:F420-non-reducing hydrogenase small subunit
VYEEAPSTENREKVRPAISSGSNGAILTLPAMRHLVRTLDQVVEVDYTIPGCPPPTRLLKEAVMALLGGSLPPQGSVLAPDIALCTDCPRKESKPEDLRFERFKRRHLSPADPDLCLLAQGFLCMGPATRSGCDSACIGGNMPCTGCLGPTSRVADQGLKYLSSISSNIDATESADIERILSGIPDPIGTFYRYGLARSILRRKIDLPA